MDHRQVAHRQVLFVHPDGAARQRQAVGAGADHGGAQGVARFAQRQCLHAGVAVQRFGEGWADVAEGAGGSDALRVVVAGADAAGQVYRIVAMAGAQAVGHQQLLRQRRGLADADFMDQAGHAAGDAGDGAVANRLAGFRKRRQSQFRADRPGRCVQVAQAAVAFEFEQVAADVEAGGVDDAAGLEHRVVGGAAADVDVEHAAGVGARMFGRARALAGDHRFQVRAGGGDG